MTLTVGLEAAAGLTYRANDHDVVAATAEFRMLLANAGLPVPANPYEYMRIWGPRMQDDGSILIPEYHSGRPRKLTDEDVHTCYAECLGWYKAGRPRPYESVQELMTNNLTVQQITTAANVSGETLTRHFKLIDPHFQYGMLRNRPYLDEQHRQNRVASCHQKLQEFEQHKPWVVYVDEKVMCLSQCCSKGWFSSEAEDYAWSMPRLTRNRQTIKLKYIIGVNYLLGPVWIKFFTGTTGMPWNREGCAYRRSDGQEATGMTADEYEDCIWDLNLTLDTISERWGLQGRPRWLLSQDNSTAHTSASLEALGIWRAGYILDLPALSPDMHKVVEHVHAFLTEKMTKWRYKRWNNKPSLEECKAKLVELFFSYKPDSVQRDIDTLPATYQAIINSGGLYAPPRVR